MAKPCNARHACPAASHNGGRNIHRPGSPAQRTATPVPQAHPALYLSEFIGTALLVFIGLSVVIALWGHGAPLANLPLTIPQRRLLNGFLFGSTGALIALSPIGKISGAHINPSVTLAFWLEGRIQWRDALGYVIAQLSGGLLGAFCLLAWGPVGNSDQYGAALPEPHVSPWLPVIGETGATFLLVSLIFMMTAHKRTRPFTPLINPPLFALLVWLESPLSGANTNLARSFGPALIAGTLHAQWVYVIGPFAGVALAVGVTKMEWLGQHHPPEARLFHFHNHAA